MLRGASGHDRPRHAIALMYHALINGGELCGQDPHYTLAAGTFRAHLDNIRRHTGGAGCARDWLKHESNGASAGASDSTSDGAHEQHVLLTFDDGHISNHRVAFPMLVEYGMRADFFVNPVNVGQPGFASWNELRQMATAGMSIQSHGYDHRYLTHLDGAALRRNLYASRLEIEDHVGTPVTLLAPPGGRMPPGLADHARQLGYTHILCSKPGLASTAHSGKPLPRLAITSSLGDPAFRRWITADVRALTTARLRYGILAIAKRTMGEARYERLRHSALSSPVA